MKRLPSALSSFLLLGLLDAISGADEWTYFGPTGVRNWCSLGNNSCCDSHQSPINFVNRRTTRGNVKQFKFTDYDKIAKKMEIINNGHTVEVTIEDDDIQPRFSGGGLDYEYIFEQFHFHWGSGTYNGGYRPGSEHLIENSQYPMELHLVHYNSKFKSITEALESEEPDALAVLGVIYDYSDWTNQGLGPIVKSLSSLKYRDDQTDLTPFPLENLLPKSSSAGFYRYWGSLTTPTCDEVVVWTVFADTEPVTVRQLYEFTKIYSTPKDDENRERMVNNFRPVQKTGNRDVYRLYIYNSGWQPYPYWR